MYIVNDDKLFQLHPRSIPAVTRESCNATRKKEQCERFRMNSLLATINTLLLDMVPSTCSILLDAAVTVYGTEHSRHDHVGWRMVPIVY